MISPSMRKYFSSTANVWNLENATAMAFFYNGGSELKNIAFQVTDRLVYRVRTSDDRMVLGYDVLNGTPENGLIIPIEDIIDGNYTLNIETPPLLRYQKSYKNDICYFLNLIEKYTKNAYFLKLTVDEHMYL